MREKIASIGTLIGLSVLSLLLLAHALLIFPGWAGVVGGTSALKQWLGSHEIKAADYIAIVSALATVGAVVLALWLARTDRRRISKEATERGQLAAASIAVRLQLTMDWISNAWIHGVFVDLEIPADAATLKAFARMVEQLRKPVFQPEAATLLNLTSLPGNCAHRIARAFDYVESVRWQVQQIPQGAILESTSAHQRKAMLESWCGALMTAENLLRVARAECDAATELGAPLPTAYEVHGEDIDWD
ncbi:hypothetical protein J2W27_000359 [Variovorax boronicumulans]|uniref:hypothetical protein n=1 Tax=Variovorax boronicumulans TaxID=436515 RepID=UPI0027865F30|nr:hypothetical protein [Variovorax boronicumulans]MDP9908266.1 hypothetical protein [Variovorax boronicumulans]